MIISQKCNCFRETHKNKGALLCFMMYSLSYVSGGRCPYLQLRVILV